jgi:hypothetical protein
VVATTKPAQVQTETPSTPTGESLVAKATFPELTEGPLEVAVNCKPNDGGDTSTIPYKADGEAAGRF